MPTLTVQTNVNKAKALALDTSAVRWTDPEWLGYHNEVQREICTLRPDACVAQASIQLVAGSRQQMPSDSVALVRLVRNMGTTGNAPSSAIRPAPMDLMDATLPGWHSSSQKQTVVNFMHDSRTPNVFFVYPPSTGSWYVEAIYATTPVEASTLAQTISVDDLYSPALIHGMLSLGYMKDNDLLGNLERAGAHRKLFESFMASRTQVDSGFRSGKGEA